MKDVIAADHTYVNLKELLPLWSEIKVDAVHVSGQSGSSYQKNDENQVWKQGGEVDKLNQE